MNIELGDKVKDRLTGLMGIAVGRTDWLFGCRRFSVQPQEAKDGKPAEMFWADEPQLIIVEKQVVTAAPPTPAAPAPKPHRTTGGPRDIESSRRSDPSR